MMCIFFAALCANVWLAVETSSRQLARTRDSAIDVTSIMQVRLATEKATPETIETTAQASYAVSDKSLSDAGTFGEELLQLPDVIVYIAGGELATSHMFSASLQTLGQWGFWHRPVVVLTDEPDCVRSCQFPRVLAHNISLTIIPIPKPPPDSGPRQRVMHYKTFKTLLWDYLESAGFSGLKRLLYLDEDILVGQSLAFLQQAITTANPSAGIMTFKVPSISPYHTSETFHTGIMVMNNDTTVRDCLHDWKNAMSSGHFERDQAALMNSACASRGSIALMSYASLPQFPTAQQMQAGQRDLFIHFCNTFHLKKESLRPAIRTYMASVMRLNTEALDPWGHFSCLGAI